MSDTKNVELFIFVAQDPVSFYILPIEIIKKYKGQIIFNRKRILNGVDLEIFKNNWEQIAVWGNGSP